MAEPAGRVRHRQGEVVLSDGVPYSNPDTTLSLLAGAAIGEWLAEHADVVCGRLLDAGCGNRPYRPWYDRLADSSIGVDAAPAAGVDAIAYAERLPFADAAFDTILCTQVLEHVENAELAIAELFRLCRPGGHLLISVPFLYPVHEAPYDYWRFTHAGLRDILERHGFEVLALDASGGLSLLAIHFGVLATVAGMDALSAVLRLRSPFTTRPWVRSCIAAPQQWWIRRRRIPRTVPGSALRATLGYMAVARRPPRS